MVSKLNGKIFATQDRDDEEVTFYRVLRSTTNTCEVIHMRKSVVYQTEDYQFVEPGKEIPDRKSRCKVINSERIKLKSSGDEAFAWDGKPLKQTAFVYLWTY